MKEELKEEIKEEPRNIILTKEHLDAVEKLISSYRSVDEEYLLDIIKYCSKHWTTSISTIKSVLSEKLKFGNTRDCSLCNTVDICESNSSQRDCKQCIHYTNKDRLGVYLDFTDRYCQMGSTYMGIHNSINCLQDAVGNPKSIPFVPDKINKVIKAFQKRAELLEKLLSNYKKRAINNMENEDCTLSELDKINSNINKINNTLKSYQNTLSTALHNKQILIFKILLLDREVSSLIDWYITPKDNYINGTELWGNLENTKLLGEIDGSLFGFILNTDEYKDKFHFKSVHLNNPIISITFDNSDNLIKFIGMFNLNLPNLVKHVEKIRNNLSVNEELLQRIEEALT